MELGYFQTAFSVRQFFDLCFLKNETEKWLYFPSLEGLMERSNGLMREQRDLLLHLFHI